MIKLIDIVGLFKRNNATKKEVTLTKPLLEECKNIRTLEIERGGKRYLSFYGVYQFGENGELIECREDGLFDNIGLNSFLNMEHKHKLKDLISSLLDQDDIIDILKQQL